MMHSTNHGRGLVAIGVVSLQLGCSAIGQVGDGWTTLFDGSSLDGWRVLGDANWELEDGAVQADSGAGFLVTEDSYADFELSLEFWVNEPANSGIFIRCADPASVTDRNSYEVNIYDTRPTQTYRTGGIVPIASQRASSMREGAGTLTRLPPRPTTDGHTQRHSAGGCRGHPIR